MDLTAASARSAAADRAWVLVAGGFHRCGGMDRANAALADYLLAQGLPVHLVGHEVCPELRAHPAVHVHPVPRPMGSFWLGEYRLARKGYSVAKDVTARLPCARVLVNGGNCRWPDINWVHWVVRAWSPGDRGAPLWFRTKRRLARAWNLRREATSVRRARLVLANSERTRRDLIAHLGLDPARVHTVYLGADPSFGLPTPAERLAAQQWLGRRAGRPLIAFVGALSHDSRKGFDVLWEAWQKLCARPPWDADLVVAGAGRALGDWRRRVAEARLSERVVLLGFTDRVAELLAAADLLVSPVRYESYGLNVHEALCRGVPAMVSASAGVAERYPADLHELLLPSPEDSEDLAARLLRWRSSIDWWKGRVAPLSRRLRSHTWTDMASQIVALAGSSGG